MSNLRPHTLNAVLRRAMATMSILVIPKGFVHTAASIYFVTLYWIVFDSIRFDSMDSVGLIASGELGLFCLGSLGCGFTRELDRIGSDRIEPSPPRDSQIGSSCR